jgi:hypothetical protein
MNLTLFKNIDNFYNALQELFKSFNIPVSYIDENSLKPEGLLEEHYKANSDAHKLMKDIFILHISATT